MNEYIVNIICTVISSFCVLLGVLLSNRNSTDKMQSEMRTAQAVTDTKIEELTREVANTTILRSAFLFWKNRCAL